MTRSLRLIVFLIIVGFAVDVRAQGDLDLLTTSVPPNVMILFDNSGSMNHHLWDDDFDPDTTYASWCGIAQGATNTITYFLSISGTVYNWTQCGRTVALYHDNSTPDSTRYDANYLNWLFTATAAQLANEPQQTRLQAAKETIISVIENVNPDDPNGYKENVRFGLAQFHEGSEPSGGFVSEPIADGNKSTIKTSINAIRGTTWTPLSETLVDIGRYFAGSNDLGSYATYNKDTSGNVPGSAPESPVDAFCRKSFVVVVTDGEPTKDLNNHHGTDFTTTIGNADGDCSEAAATGAACDPGTDSPSTGRDDGLSFPSSGSDWLDDVALYLKNTDLDTDMTGTQNVITYTIGFTIDHPILSETATNGSGLYFTTSDTTTLVSQLSIALQDIIDRSTAFSATTVPTARTAFGDAFYTGFFLPSDTDGLWEGHLQAYRLNKSLQVVDKNEDLAIDSQTLQFIEPRNPFWDAGDELAKTTHPARVIYTTKSGVRTTFDKTNMTATDLDISASELAIYPNYPNTTWVSAEALADGLVDYLIGQDSFDEDDDNDPNELRAVVLGDLFHSSPIAIGPPSNFLEFEDGFGPFDDQNSFLGQYAERDRKVYVGANDGMLHAFNAGELKAGDNPDSSDETENGYYDMGSGQEEFAYIPGFLLDKVKHIPRNLPRQYWYVDGSPSAADVWIGSSTGDTSKEAGEWTTVLVQGMRQGGSGYIALDVTEPGATGGKHGPYPKLLWEIDESDADLGEGWSEPIITRVMLKGGSVDMCGLNDPNIQGCRERWVAIIAGGYLDAANPNNSAYISDPNHASWSDRSKGVFMFAIDTGELIGQAAYDSDGTKIENQMRYAVPSTPAVVDSNFDGFADLVYFGDLGGQMWRWDISKVGEDTTTPDDGIMDNWPVGLFFKSDPASLSGGGLHYHSIFYPPVVTLIDGSLVLGFASGERTDLQYEGNAADDDNNRFWVAWDRVKIGQDPDDPNTNWYTLHEDHQTVNGTKRGLNDISNIETDPDTDDDGYYIKIPDGEKFITNHILFNGILLTLAYVPDNSGSSICESLGSTNVWGFKLEDGFGIIDENAADGNPQRVGYLGPGLPTDPRISITEDKVVLIGQTSLGNIFEVDLGPDPGGKPVSRVYWRQIF